MVDIHSTDEELMAAFEIHRANGNGEPIGNEADTPARAVIRASESGEVIGMTVVRAIYAGTNHPGTPVLATDIAERLWIVNDLNGPWAIQVG